MVGKFGVCRQGCLRGICPLSLGKNVNFYLDSSNLVHIFLQIMCRQLSAEDFF